MLKTKYRVLTMHLVIILSIFCLYISSSYAEDYKVAYFDQKLDHFNFQSYGSKTFKQRYLYNDTFWHREQGPIFFYAGNEGPIDGLWENNGFVKDIAPIYGALVVFVEHRYYGKSLPFGNDSFVAPNIGLLSIQQSLADYAFFIRSFKTDFKAEKCPVIAFGGSYGGMLAAYMRFKFPNIVIGSIAASAPIYLTAGILPGEIFFQGVSKDFHDASPKCENQVRAAFAQLNKWAATGQAGLDIISKTFRLCEPLTSEADYDHLLRWARNAFVTAAMLDYPYPAKFMNSFPAYPVKVMCDRLVSEDVPASGLRSACDLYYNTTGNVECHDIYKEYLYCADPTGCGLGFDSMAWDYQACTEINLEGGTDGVNDMFPVLPFNSSMRDKYCQKTWNVTPRRKWLDVLYWGKDISAASNIVFSNGDLDPWGTGGVLTNISESLVAVIVEGGAHHLDLRGYNPADPPSVVEARNFEMNNILKWLKDFYSRSKTFSGVDSFDG